MPRERRVVSSEAAAAEVSENSLRHPVAASVQALHLPSRHGKNLEPRHTAMRAAWH